ncbi:MAG: hypothetical protein LBH05_07350 [Deferribacteraceae bacterium]|jgi:hypothetical protein|nr:hypothetical protein [Deferribacteraceae bacterium]
MRLDKIFNLLYHFLTHRRVVQYSSSTRHCEERSDEAIQFGLLPAWIAALHKKHSARKYGLCNAELL